ncbi:MAG: hypothetical protein J5930_07145 [Treponema sp.]|nr:hypothetical protein [Treponema sp.]
MKMIQKTFCALVLALCTVASAFAIDFGGTFNNGTRLYTNDFSPMSFSQQDGITAWVRQPFNNSINLYLAAEGTALFRYSVSDMNKFNSSTFVWCLDLSLLKAGFRFDFGENQLRVSAGRFFVSDVTGLIVGQNLDGAQAVFDAGFLQAGVYAGYSGLTNSQFATILNSSSSTYKNRSSYLYNFNSPYVVTGGSVRFPYLFANQTLTAEVLFAIGTAGPNGSNAGDNRIYATAGLNGPIVKDLFYTFSTTLGIDNGVNNMTDLSVTYYPPFLSSSATFSAVYASGDNGFMKPFRGFTSMQSTYSYSAPEYTGLLKMGVSGTIKPLQGLLAGVGFDVVMDCASGFAYSGVQWNANVQYRLFTDVVFGLDVSQYWGASEKQNSTSFKLNAAISF